VVLFPGMDCGECGRAHTAKHASRTRGSFAKGKEKKDIQKEIRQMCPDPGIEGRRNRYKQGRKKKEITVVFRHLSRLSLKKGRENILLNANRQRANEARCKGSY